MDRADFDDDEVLSWLATGDERGLLALYDRYGRLVYSLILSIVGHQGVAEGLTQEVFLRSWRQESSFELDRGYVQSWLLGIAHHVAIDEIRRGDSRPQRFLDGTDASRTRLEVSDRSPMSEGLVPGGVGREAVVAALAELSQDQRRILEMANFEGLTQTEMVQRTLIPLDIIKTTTHSALQCLRSNLLSGGSEADAL